MSSGRYNSYNNTNLARKTTVLSTEDSQRQERTVVQPNTVKAQRVLLLVFTVAVFAFAMVARSQALVAAGNTLVSLRQQEAGLIRQNDLLRLEVNKLKSPERINTIAKNVLGMTIAKQNIYIDKEPKQ